MQIIYPVYQCDWHNCSLNQITINSLFQKLNTYYTAHTPTYYLTVDVSGPKHASPTDGSSNTNILSLRSIFTSAGQTLTIRHN